jgi:hypothetical protein
VKLSNCLLGGVFTTKGKRQVTTRSMVTRRCGAQIGRTNRAHGGGEVGYHAEHGNQETNHAEHVNQGKVSPAQRGERARR